MSFHYKREKEIALQFVYQEDEEVAGLPEAVQVDRSPRRRRIDEMDYLKKMSFYYKFAPT
jgi:hypothetical protein